MSDDDEDELALIVDVGLTERLREANVDVRYCCIPGAVGRGMKPKRVCIAVGGGARFVIDIGLVESKDVKFKITAIIEGKGYNTINIGKEKEKKCRFDKR